MVVIDDHVTYYQESGFYCDKRQKRSESRGEELLLKDILPNKGVKIELLASTCLRKVTLGKVTE